MRNLFPAATLLAAAACSEGGAGHDAGLDAEPPPPPLTGNVIVELPDNFSSESQLTIHDADGTIVQRIDLDERRVGLQVDLIDGGMVTHSSRAHIPRAQTFAGVRAGDRLLFRVRDLRPEVDVKVAIADPPAGAGFFDADAGCVRLPIDELVVHGECRDAGGRFDLVATARPERGGDALAWAFAGDAAGPSVTLGDWRTDFREVRVLGPGLREARAWPVRDGLAYAVDAVEDRQRFPALFEHLLVRGTAEAHDGYIYRVVPAASEVIVDAAELLPPVTGFTADFTTEPRRPTFAWDPQPAIDRVVLEGYIGELAFTVHAPPETSSFRYPELAADFDPNGSEGDAWDLELVDDWRDYRAFLADPTVRVDAIPPGAVYRTARAW